MSYSDNNQDGVINSNYNDPAYEIRENKAYYPFGLTHNYGVTSPLSVVSGTVNNNNTYQNQELHEELDLNVYEFKYRFYDPSIGRFWSIDPLADKYSYNSTYAFGENKLGMGIELEGLEMFPTEVAIWFSIRASEIALKWNSGKEKVTESSSTLMRMKTSIPEPGFDSDQSKREAQLMLISGLADMSEVVTDAGHLTLDVIGTVEPTGLADGVHSLWYASEGDYLNAGLTAGGILPYIGDSFKAGKYLKYGDEISDIVKATGKLDGGKEIITVLNNGVGTLDNGIKTAKNIIGELGDDAIDKLGKFGSQDGVRVGSQSANGKKGWRVDYDAKKGGHINWWNGKEKGAIIINAGQNQIDQIIKNGTF